MPEEKSKWSVEVYGDNILKPMIASTDESRMVVVRDTKGRPAIALIRVTDTQWGVSTCADEDWNGVCIRYGIS